jgi:hypothetical protein
MDGLRLTFDSMISGVRPSARIFSPDFDFSRHHLTMNYPDIFEIKSYSAAPESLHQKLEQQAIAACSFSKYAEILRRLLEESDDSRLSI